jgi:opacity protein-like surface antigen
MKRSLVLALLALPPASTAFAEEHAIGLKVGALGLGAEYTYQLKDRIALRGGVYGSQVGFDATESGIEYEFDFVWDSVSAGVDFHPLKSALRLSVGLLKNDNGLEAVSRPTGNVTVGDTVYTPAQIGALQGTIRFDDTATFVGVGWDWSRDRRLFGMSFDLGLLKQGDPVVTLRGNGTLLGDPAFEQDIRAEEAELAASTDDFDVIPFVAVGLLFRF